MNDVFINVTRDVNIDTIIMYSDSFTRPDGPMSREYIYTKYMGATGLVIN